MGMVVDLQGSGTRGSLKPVPNVSLLLGVHLPGFYWLPAQTPPFFSQVGSVDPQLSLVHSYFSEIETQPATVELWLEVATASWKGYSAATLASLIQLRTLPGKIRNPLSVQRYCHSSSTTTFARASNEHRGLSAYLLKRDWPKRWRLTERHNGTP